MSQVKITPALLADLRAKAEAATPGPWKWHDNGHSYSVEGPVRGNRLHDSQHVAAANPAVVLALIARIEELEADQ
jgi:hypothetical protein